jgi:hypothetical protein
VQGHLGGGGTVGHQRLLVQEQNQGGPLPQGRATGSPVPDPLGLFQDIGRKAGAIDWCGTAPGEPPGTNRLCVSIPRPLTVYLNDPGRKTLQLIVKQAT